MPFYRTARLSGITDRNLPHQLREKLELDTAAVYLWSEIEAFSKLFFSERNDQAFQAHLKQALERYQALKKEERELFRRDAGTYVTAYDFLSQLVSYDEPDLEKLRAFLKMLLPRLKGEGDDLVMIDGAARLAGFKLKNKTEHTLDLVKGDAVKLVELPRFRGHFFIQEGVRDANPQTAVSGGVSSADGRTGARRSRHQRSGPRVRLQRQQHPRMDEGGRRP